MATLLEMATEVVLSMAASSTLSKDELLAEIAAVHKGLAAIEKGEVLSEGAPGESAAPPAISRKKAFGKDKVVCMLCGKGMKTLARHLKTAHGLKPGEYRKQFDIPRAQPLAAKAYSESRRQMAVERGLGDNLAKARAARSRVKKKKA
jgi:predicted transcriptional regulator